MPSRLRFRVSRLQHLPGREKEPRSRMFVARLSLPSVVSAAAANFMPGPKRLALKIDQVMREQAPAGWKGDQAREAQVQNALFPLLDRNREATRALFELVKNQPGY